MRGSWCIEGRGTAAQCRMNPADRRASLRAHIAVRGLAQRENLTDAARREGISEKGDGFWKTHSAAVLFWREFLKADGLQLNPKLWRLETGARQAFADAVESALIHGHSIERQCQIFLSSERHLIRLALNDLVSNADPEVEADFDSDGSMRDHVRGLFHHYINFAHGSAYMATGEGTPGFGGWRYCLSPAEDFPGLSTLYAEQNLFGLGSGVYPDRARCPWPKFRDLAYVVMAFKDEITDADRAGRETPIQTLARLSPMELVDVLGHEKTHYFEKGWLRSWMVNSPDTAVRLRLFRTGKLQSNQAPPRSEGALSLDEYYLLCEIARGPGPYLWHEDENQDEEPDDDLSRILARLVDQGLAEHLSSEERLATLERRLVDRTKMTEIRALCAELGLGHGRTKQELIQRVVQHAPDRGEALMGTTSLLKITDAGRSLIAAEGGSHDSSENRSDFRSY